MTRTATKTTTMTSTTTNTSPAGVAATEPPPARRRSTGRRVLGAVALACAAGVVLWAGGRGRPDAAAVAPPPQVQGRKLVDYGRGATVPPSQSNPNTASAEGAKAAIALATGKLDFTNAAQMEKRTIREIPIVMDGDYRKVTFTQMGSWEYKPPAIPKEGEVPPALTSIERFPPPIRDLNGEKISVEGYMIPVEVDRDKVKSFVFVSSPLVCCFGLVPKLNEWFLVRMAGDGRAFIMMDLPITVRGRLSLGEEIKNRSIVSLYRIEADEVVGPRDF